MCAVTKVRIRERSRIIVRHNERMQWAHHHLTHTQCTLNRDEQGHECDEMIVGQTHSAQFFVEENAIDTICLCDDE